MIGVGAGGEGERRDEHLVARADAEQQQRQVQRGRARLEARPRAATPDGCAELLLEGVDVRAERRDPVGVEGLEQQFPLVSIDGAGKGRSVCSSEAPEENAIQRLVGAHDLEPEPALFHELAEGPGLVLGPGHVVEVDKSRPP